MDQTRAVSHPLQAEPNPIQSLRRQPASVIGHPKDDPGGVLAEFEVDLRSSAVAHRIVNSLLRDAVEMIADPRADRNGGQTVTQAANMVPFHHCGNEFPQRFDETLAVSDDWVKPMRDLPGVGSSLGNAACNPAHLCCQGVVFLFQQTLKDLRRTTGGDQFLTESVVDVDCDPPPFVIPGAQVFKRLSFGNA